MWNQVIKFLVEMLPECDSLKMSSRRPKLVTPDESHRCPVHFTSQPLAWLLWAFGAVPIAQGSAPCPTLSAPHKAFILKLGGTQRNMSTFTQY